MGKRPISILKSSKNNLVSFPYILSKKKGDKHGYRGINIRITNKSNITIDFECYDKKGERIKAKELINGKIKSGDYSDTKTNEFNNRIHEINGKIQDYIDQHESISKELLNGFVYPSGLVESHKRKRTKYLTFPVFDRGKIIDSLELEKQEVDEFMNQYFVKNKETGKMESVTDPETGEYVIQSQEDFEEILVDAHSTKERGERIQKFKMEIAGMPTKDRYSKGYFNKNDIFEVFAMTYYDDKNEITNDFYPKIVIRLFEYKERVNPPSHVRDYNLKWILNFFKWLDENGFYRINTKGFDPLKYDSKIFFREKQRNQYKGKSLQKMIDIVKNLSATFAKLKLLPKVTDLDDLTLKSFSKKKNRAGTRKEYALTKDEFDTIFHHQILTQDIVRYQSIFDQVNDSKEFKVSVENLQTAKDMFICQTMFGGLRGWHDYKTCSIKKHAKDILKVCFKVGKKDDAIENPLNAYTKAILSRTGQTIPFINNEQHYRSLVKTIVRFLSETLDRDVKPNKFENEYVKVYELFQPGWFSRKTFAQILHKIGVEEDDIKLFTGHESEEDELSISYLDKNTIEKKTEMIKKLRIGKGLETP
jgi:hypothetical protein